MSKALLQDLSKLADTFLSEFPSCTAGEEATAALQQYMERREDLFAQLTQAGGAGAQDVGVARELLARDEKVRQMLVEGASAIQGELKRLHSGRRALRGYKTDGVVAKRTTVKG